MSNIGKLTRVFMEDCIPKGQNPFTHEALNQGFPSGSRCVNLRGKPVLQILATATYLKFIKYLNVYGKFNRTD